VTLALGAFTPGVTEEPEPELPEELDELPPDFPFELAPELPPELAPELAPELTLDMTLLPGGCNATPPSMGANPRTIVITQRVRSIVLSVLSVCGHQRGAQRPFVSRTKTHDYPRLRHVDREQHLPERAMKWCELTFFEHTQIAGVRTNL
jgi:hypothetical protein